MVFLYINQIDKFYILIKLSNEWGVGHMINIKHLKAFIAVASELHFTRAAEKVFLTQPALSSLIQQLEQDVGIQLVRRHTRQVELSDAGKDFKVTAEKLVADFEQAIYDVKSYQSIRRGKVTVAALPSVCIFLLPPVLKKFSQDYPDINLQVTDCAGQEILAALNDKHIDFGISYSQADKNLEATTLLKDALVIVCDQNHIFAQRKEVRWSELANEPLVVMEKGTTIRTLIDSNAVSQDMKLDFILEPKLMPTAIAYVEAGLGVTILPSTGVGKNLPESLKVVPLISPKIERGIAILRRREIPLSPAAKAFKEYLHQYA
jgi:LysR family carnitine catabolism transcriptional activator